MIARIWKGRTRAGQADAYVEYVERTGIAAHRATPGNRASMILRRDCGEEVEVVVISFWDSLDSVRGFAGEQPDVAVYFPEDADYLLEMEPAVLHYDVAVRESD